MHFSAFPRMPHTLPISRRKFQRICPSPRPDHQARGPPIVGCAHLLIQYNYSYPPYLEVFSSNCNPRMRHAVVTRTHITRWQTRIHWTINLACDNIGGEFQGHLELWLLSVYSTHQRMYRHPVTGTQLKETVEYFTPKGSTLSINKFNIRIRTEVM